MTQRPLDRRVRRTRAALAKALLTLIETKEYDAITIQQITDAADLNRATFYLHYANKEELLTDSLEAMFDELVAQFSDIVEKRPLWEDATAELAIFNHIAEHASLYKVLLSERGQGYVIYRIVDYIAAYAKSQTGAHLPPESALNLPKEIISHHVAGSIFALVSWWVQNDMPYEPEYMASAVNQLCTYGALSCFVPSSNASLNI